MATYLVLKRMLVGGETSYAGALVTRDPAERETQILLERGFLTPVPDNYGDGSSSEATDDAAEGQGAAGAADDGSSGSSSDEPEYGDPEALAKLTRAELDDLARAEGIGEPEAYANKTEVAYAIVEKRIDNDLVKAINGLTDIELDAAIEAYEVEVPEESTREGKITALTEWARENPEEFTGAPSDESEPEPEGDGEEEPAEPEA